MKHAITFLLCLSLAQCGLSPAWADMVALPDAPDPFFEPGGPDASDLAASVLGGTDLAMLYDVPASGSTNLSPATPVGAPIRLQAETGGNTRIAVDAGAVQSTLDRSWPTWVKVTVVVGSVAVVALASWAIVEACQHGEHTSGDDASTHYNVAVGGEGNTVNIRLNSDESTQTSTGGY